MARKKKPVGKYILWALLFVCAFLTVGYKLGDLLQHKWNYEENNAAQQIVQGYYAEEKNSLDVLYLGASTIRNSISPLEMWAEYGFTGYSRATSIQTPIVSYYLLLETLEKHDLKAVVIDATTLVNVTNDKTELEGKMHEAIDFMRLSKYKAQLIEDTARIYDMSRLDFYSSLYRYHDRWSDLEEQDFNYHTWGRHYPYKGQYPVLKTTRYQFPEDYMQEGIRQDTDFYIDPIASEYFGKIVDLCKEKKIEIILIKTPVANWDWNKHETVSGFADANSVSFLDFCIPELQKEIGFNEKQDFCDDGRHPNISGGKKISRYVGKYLKEHCKLKDKRENEDYEQWWKDYQLYQCLLEDVELLRESDFFAYVDKLKQDRYVVMVATQNDSAKYFSMDMYRKMQELGLQTDLSERSYLSYIAMLDGENVIHESSALGESVGVETEIDGHTFALQSFADRAVGNYSSFLVDGEQKSLYAEGLTFVVYDKTVEQIVSRRNFNTGRTGKRYE